MSLILQTDKIKITCIVHLDYHKSKHLRVMINMHSFRELFKEVPVALAKILSVYNFTQKTSGWHILNIDDIINN